ncbi:hypothetical protein [Mucilaginibacter sp. UR6-11]|uniref:hypothetical protein n=1 Tax=Mucilaginibacter sp. UR6-11 TaxID=1435644 RepID=UPI001E4184CF|nr:hypothetical protein [Mucilaginibacter sp. UR6-11]MCC8424992.1 hypothetical protein [Mucilaginibacter sp. UR6-11]
MKKIVLVAVIALIGFYAKAQEQLAFPFQGGKEVMARFFKDSLIVSPQLIARKATGTAVFKFTADEKGTIKKIIIYYADDITLTEPIIEALKKSNHKWIIPDHEKFHDFIIPFSISFTPPAIANAGLQRAVYNFYKNRKPVVSLDQVPLDMATLLPTVLVNYDL